MASHGLHQDLVQGMGYPHARFPVTQADALRDFGVTLTSIWDYQIAGNPGSIPPATVIPDLVGTVNMTTSGPSSTPVVGTPFANKNSLQFIGGGAVTSFLNGTTADFNVLAGADLLHVGIVQPDQLPTGNRELIGKYSSVAPNPFWRLLYIATNGRFTWQLRDTAGTVYVTTIAAAHNNRLVPFVVFISRASALGGVWTPLGYAQVGISANGFSDGTGIYRHIDVTGATSPCRLLWMGGVLASAPANQTAATVLGQRLWKGGIPIPGAL